MVRSTNEARPGIGYVPVAEVLLAGVTVATVASMWRLFDDGSYFLPLTIHAVLAHGLATVLRRRGVGVAASAAICLAAGALALVWGHLGSTTAYGFPTGDTLSAAGDQLDVAWRTFGDVRAPAPVLTGFLLSAGAAIWVGAWLSDLAAFRFWTPFEALIPAGTLFVFASLFSADRSRALAGALWLAAALAFVLVHRTAGQQGSPSWLGSDPRIGTRALVKVGAGLAVVAVALGWAIGPRLPGADAEPIVPFAPEDEGGSRQTVSPLVEIRGRLVEQSPIEMFTVVAGQRAYWRLTALDLFDGDVWWSRGSFGEADGDLDGSGNGDTPTTPVSQTFRITGLSDIWVPAAFEAAELDAGDEDVRWDDESSTLIVSTDYESSDGLTYDVVSDVPSFDPATLAAAGDEVPGDIAERGLDLPDDFPASVIARAQEIVAGAGSPYERAIALQNSFRDGSFTYSLDAPPGHSDTAIESFLFDTRTGYCEQFAGTYAAMARAVGLPARVAVGFTPGDPDPSQPGRYIVRGEHAHAWPEVWLAGAGWVAFEPTPGRGAPGAEDYTGAVESQDTPGESTQPSTVPTVPEPSPEVTTPGQGGGTASTAPPFEDPGAEPEGLGPVEDDDGNPIGRVLAIVGLVLAAIVLLVVLAAAAVAIGRELGRRRRRSRAAADGPERLVEVLWQEAVELGPVVGVARRAFETPRELGLRLAQASGSAGASTLASVATRAAFDPAGVGDDGAAQAVELIDGLRDAVRTRSTRWARLAHAIDPRPAHRRGGRRNRPGGPRIQISLVAQAERA